MAIADATDIKLIKPHVALVSSPGLGHVTPLLELGKLLVLRHGFHVTFLVITTTVSSPALDALLRSPSLPEGLCILDLPPVDVSSVVPPGALLLTQVSVLARESFRSLASVLLSLSPKPIAFITDMLCTDAFEICRPLSIPVYSFFTTSAAFMAMCVYAPVLDGEVEGEFVDLPGPVQVPGCTPVRTCDLLDQVRDRKSDEYKWYLRHMTRLPMTAGLLVNSWDGLEPVSLKAVRENPVYRKIIKIPPVYAIGPVIKPAEQVIFKGECSVVSWLDMQPAESVLLVTLGSGGTLTSEQLAELAWGLELSRQRFLLVARKPSDASASGAYFTVGGDEDDPKAYLPEGFVSRTEGLGLVVPSWAPQSAVLGHRATGAFLSHCGWNSALESVAGGVPMIAWPMYAEQRMNAAVLAEELGVAARAGPREGRGGVVGRGEIERVVRMVMEGEEGTAMRNKAKQLRDSAVKALTVGGSSRDALTLLVKKWTSE